MVVFIDIKPKICRICKKKINMFDEFLLNYDYKIVERVHKDGIEFVKFGNYFHNRCAIKMLDGEKV